MVSAEEASKSPNRIWKADIRIFCCRCNTRFVRADTVTNTYKTDQDWSQVDGPTIGHIERRLDDQNRLSGWTTANGATPGFSYDENGVMQYETNSLGVVTEYVYDLVGRVSATTNVATDAGTTYAYDLAGQRIGVTNALGQVTLTGYHEDGSLAATTNALGRYWLYTNSMAGSCCGSTANTTVTDPLGRKIVNNVSDLGLPLETIRIAGANSRTNRTTYLAGMIDPDEDATEYPETITDEGGRVRRFAYTELGMLERATDLSGSTWWTNQYDLDSGALTNVLSPTGETLSYTYDDLDNLKTIRFGDGHYLTNNYNADDNRLGSVNLPSGATVTNLYDDSGRLTNRFSAVGETAVFEYNLNDAETKMSDNTGSTTNLYDDAGRFYGIDYPSGGSVRYGLDLLDRITNITVKASSGGTAYVTAYTYDAVGNVTNINDPLNGNTSFEYDEVNRKRKRTLPNAVVTTYDYNEWDQVTNIVHKLGSTVLASFAYERAQGGEPTKITREDGAYVILGYDAALRLTNEVYYSSDGTPQTTNSYAYDAAGNRLRLAQGSQTLTNAVSAGHQVKQVKDATSGSTVETYDYDNGGRVTNIVRSSITLRLGYNTVDQVTAVTKSTASTWVTYVPDGEGRRTISTNSAGTVRRFLVAHTPQTDLESPLLLANANASVQAGD